MFSIKITRRQFLKWLSTSAAALGLSQTDLLKVEKAFANGPTPDPNMPLGTLGRGRTAVDAPPHFRTSLRILLTLILC
jgi:hypothetical protein